jgi:hypothetical protein
MVGRQKTVGPAFPIIGILLFASFGDWNSSVFIRKTATDIRRLLTPGVRCINDIRSMREIGMTIKDLWFCVVGMDKG